MMKPNPLLVAALAGAFLMTGCQTSREEVPDPTKHQVFTGDDFAGWQEPTGKWLVVGKVHLHPENDGKFQAEPGFGIMVNGPEGNTSNLISDWQHGDVEAHIEFCIPEGSNSGVYFQGRYEIQIFDSFGVEEPEHSDCGGIYQRWVDETGEEGYPPRVNASKRPGEWQTFDVVFRAPRFDELGNKVENARFVSVKHNGVVVHRNQEVGGPTRAAAFDDEQSFGPLMLQGDHGPVAYRNIQVREVLLP